MQSVSNIHMAMVLVSQIFIVLLELKLQYSHCKNKIVILANSGLLLLHETPSQASALHWPPTKYFAYSLNWHGKGVSRNCANLRAVCQNNNFVFVVHVSAVA